MHQNFLRIKQIVGSGQLFLFKCKTNQENTFLSVASFPLIWIEPVKHIGIVLYNKLTYRAYIVPL